MADTPSTPSALASTAANANSWAGLAPFIAAAFGQGQGMNNYMTQLQNQHPIQPHTPAATPTNLAGMGAGPFVQQGLVPGPTMQTPTVSSPVMPSALPAMPTMQMPSFTNPAATSPMVGLPSLKTSAPLTADHFTTGAPNPFGNR